LNDATPAEQEGAVPPNLASLLTPSDEELDENLDGNFKPGDVVGKVLALIGLVCTCGKDEIHKLTVICR
jgi:hypothetical protein